MKIYILRGACAGVIAALVTGLVLLLLGEASIRDAIALEEAANTAAGAAHEDPLFSRPMQVVGGTIGVLLYGTFIGTIFGIVYAAAQRSLGAVAEWKRALRLAGLAFVAIYLVPFLKYPANPPAVGDPDTVNDRTIAYLAVIAIAIVVTVVAVRVCAHLAARGWPDHLRVPAAVLLWTAVIGAMYAILPGNPDEIEVSATLIWRFRLASLGGQAAFWAVAGVVFGWLTIMHSGRKVFAVAEGDPVKTGA